MGSTGSKFKKQVESGEEFAALHLYQKHLEFRRNVDPNTSFGPDHNTYVHLAAKHGMKTLLRLFLFDHGGNPNKTNNQEKTALHFVCENCTGSVNRRADTLVLLISWEGPALEGGKVEKLDLDAQDVLKNTALHYAATAGLKQCVEILVQRGANMFVENEQKETACDCAERQGHHEIAEFLETKMVFAPEPPEDLNEDDIGGFGEMYSGLRELDLREAKDQLLVETADMLHVPLFTAEALLRNHEWSREALLEAWMHDPIVCCENCHIDPPLSALGSTLTADSMSLSGDGEEFQYIHSGHAAAQLGLLKAQSEPDASEQDSELAGKLRGLMEVSEDSHTFTTVADLVSADEDLDAVPSTSCAVASVEKSVVSAEKLAKQSLKLLLQPCQVPVELEALECEICYCTYSPRTAIINSACDHGFCRECWKNYLTAKIKEGDLDWISCPAHACSKLVPVELIERSVSPITARKYLKFDIKAFVESNPRIKWCPHPGCSNAVKLPDYEDGSPLHLRAFPRVQPPPPTSKTVYCPGGHGFCWDCSGPGHEPTSCDRWEEWHDKIKQIRPEELKGTSEAHESAANCLWLVTNSKPCPKCRSPIQKNEGCNHMKCSKCKFDFCWVCLGPWKKHNTETGGYFRCNRYEDSRKIDSRSEQQISHAKVHSKKTQELNRFVHYYTRYKNHLNSLEMEKPLLNNVKSKMDQLAKSAVIIEDEYSAEDISDLSFIETAVMELLRVRRVLSSSYAYGYFLKDHGYNKTIFEYLQNELELCVENLSGMVARAYLRNSRYSIKHASALVMQKRTAFLVCISRGLLPPETPPGVRKSRRRHMPALLGMDAEEEDYAAVGLPTAEELNPDRPWVKDKRGRHHNLLTLMDWPEEPESSDEEGQLPSSLAHVESLRTGSVRGRCDRTGCSRRKAKNPRTGALHSYCSLQCKFMDAECKASVEAHVAGPEYNVDLMIALQMSRIQLLQDLKLLDDYDLPAPQRLNSNIASSYASNSTPFVEDIDPDMQMAIQRSMELPPLSGSTISDPTGSHLSTESELAVNEAPIEIPVSRPPDPHVLNLFIRRFTGKETTLPINNICPDNDFSNNNYCVDNVSISGSPVLPRGFGNKGICEPSSSAAPHASPGDGSMDSVDSAHHVRAQSKPRVPPYLPGVENIGLDSGLPEAVLLNLRKPVNKVDKVLLCDVTKASARTSYGGGGTAEDGAGAAGAGGQQDNTTSIVHPWSHGNNPDVLTGDRDLACDHPTRSPNTARTSPVNKPLSTSAGTDV